MKKVWLVVLLFVFCATSVFADTKASPPPTFDNPRKAVFQASVGDDRAIGTLLNYINNLLKAYQPGHVTISVIAWGDGIKLLEKKNNPYQSRIKTFQDLDVEFVACMNTMEYKKLKTADMLNGVTFVQAGLQEIIERDLSGWTYIKP